MMGLVPLWEEAEKACFLPLPHLIPHLCHTRTQLSISQEACVCLGLDLGLPASETLRNELQFKLSSLWYFCSSSPN